jgi:hypothetical protein
MAFAVKVLDEDRVMYENQVPKEVLLNHARGVGGVLVSVGDLFIGAFRKCFPSIFIGLFGDILVGAAFYYPYKFFQFCICQIKITCVMYKRIGKTHFVFNNFSGRCTTF